MKGLRILYVSPCEPAAEGAGSQQRSDVAVEALRALGEVHHLSLPPSADALPPAHPLFVARLSGAELVAAHPALWRPLLSPSRWRGLAHDSWITAGRLTTPNAAQNRELIAQVRQRFGAARFDLIYAFQAHAGAFVDRAFDALLAPGGLTVVDWDAAERPGVAEQSRQRDGGRSWKSWLGRQLNDAKLARAERRLLRASGLTLCASEVDVAYFRHRHRRPGARVHALPNCVHLPQPPATLQQHPGHRVLFVGLVNYWPNRVGLLGFLRDVWPGVRQQFPDAEFTIVGRGVTDDVQAHHGRDGVCVVGAVAHVGACYAACDVAVAPMPFSVGSSIKVLEAPAHRRPVVAYEAATRRHPLLPGSEICSARDAADFQRQLIGLLADPAHARRIAAGGFAKVATACGRAQVVQRLEHIIRDSLAAARAQPATGVGQ